MIESGDIGQFRLFEKPGHEFILAYLFEHEHRSRTTHVTLTSDMVTAFMRGLDNEIPFLGAIWFRRNWNTLVGKNFPNSMWSHDEPVIQNRHTYRNPEWLQRQRNNVAAHNAAVASAAAASPASAATSPRPQLIFPEMLEPRLRPMRQRMSSSPENVGCSRCTVSGGRRRYKKTRKV